MVAMADEQILTLDVDDDPPGPLGRAMVELAATDMGYLLLKSLFGFPPALVLLVQKLPRLLLPL